MWQNWQHQQNYDDERKKNHPILRLGRRLRLDRLKSDTILDMRLH